MSESWYERHILPFMTDRGCGNRHVRRQRERVVPRASGRVLEVGIGTGLNLEHYDKAKVRKIIALDPALAMHRLARQRIARSGLEVELIGVSAEVIPLQDESVDSVLVTYSLCTMTEPLAALREMRRVLAPGGRLIFCEHGRSPDERVRRWQDRLTPVWRRMAGGCHLNRDIPALLRAAGFRYLDLETGYLPGPRIMTYNYWGEAVGR